METKKKPHSDLERKRFTFFQVGLIVSLTFALIAFEWRSYYNPVFDLPAGKPNEITEILPPVTFYKTPPKPKIPVIAPEIVPVEELADPVDENIDEVVEDPIDGIPTVEFGPEENLSGFAPTIFIEVAEMPEYPGGMKAFYKFMNEHTRYPAHLKKNKVEGIVYLKFIVETDGSISIDEYKGTDPAFVEEVLRVMKLMPKWKPGKQVHQPVRVYQSLPVKFSLKN